MKRLIKLGIIIYCFWNQNKTNYYLEDYDMKEFDSLQEFEIHFLDQT